MLMFLSWLQRFFTASTLMPDFGSDTPPPWPPN